MCPHGCAARSWWSWAILGLILSCAEALGQGTYAPAPLAAPSGEFNPIPPLPPPAPVPPEAPPESPPFCQKLRFDHTFLPGSGPSGLQVQEIELSSTFAVPFAENQAPLLLAPGFIARLFAGPSSSNPGSPDLPPEVYDVNLEFDWRPRLAEWLFADIAVQPGLYTDFREVNAQSFRLRGRGLAIIALSEQFQFVVGALYTNRNNTKVLPVGGFFWYPSDDWKVELVFPAPKIAYRFACNPERQWWAYVAGEFGGGAWTIERASGVGDNVDYTDWRVLLGVECCSGPRHKGRLEIGYVFSRSLDYVSATPNFDPESTVLVRAGLTY